MTLNKFCPVAQGEYYDNKSPWKSQLFFTCFFIFLFVHENSGMISLGIAIASISTDLDLFYIFIQL